ncbi:hypothetical protein D1614_14810 [Maribellus luteus]|uniref:Uncharacterized protein n=1 Tax=Maribellus luteus TaxID=2305463 RepID=A0A399T075_9BACT|nr:hypothetical protein [Maribellus luteus]RIJ47383.1 hypothetical protein D1614_14810 [Maribellus luteus]
MIDPGKHIRLLMFLFFFISGTFVCKAQESGDLTEGRVSYLSGENIYVRFESTEGIESGDTLYVRNAEGLFPALLVQHKSSISCLCNSITEATIKVSDSVFARSKQSRSISQKTIPEEAVPEKDVSEEVLTAPQSNRETTNTPSFSGRLMLSSYSNFSKQGSDSHRFRYTFSSNYSNIGHSKISFESYVSFTHKLNEWQVVRDNLNDALKIYALAVKYDVNKQASVWLGRKINPRIANVGAIDGIQLEYAFKSLFVGVVAGSRPDYLDYGFNSHLFEYGAYLGHSQKTTNGYVQSSLAFFEQRNSGNIDRRFLYFQHTNSLVKNLNLFTSVELDLYKLENDQPTNSLSLIGFYFSLNYLFSRKVSLSGSYDNRKNVIYYETFRSYADEVLTQASRQGIRGRIHYRPLDYLLFGASAGTRFTKDDPRNTNTYNAFATWSRVPVLDASLNISANLMQTSYLDGQVYGARLTKDFSQKMSMMLHYRWVDFKYVNSLSTLIQHIGELDFSYRFNKKIYLSVNFEATVQKEDIYNRLYLSLRKKF